MADAPVEKTDGGALTWIALAIFSTILLVVFIFSGPAYAAFCSQYADQDQNCFRGVLSEFQTLITGLAAVAAATITIRVMRRSDDRQEERHRELVELSLREDRLKAERALVPQTADLHRLSGQLGYMIARVTSQSIDKVYFEKVRQLCESSQRVLEFSQEVIERDAFVDGLPLFDGKLSASLAQFRRRLDKRAALLAEGVYVEGEGNSTVEEFPWAKHAPAFRAMKIIQTATEICDELKRIASGLHRMAGIYGVESSLGSEDE